MENWKDCKRLLVIRLDNMGDLIMSNAALAELKEKVPDCHLTLLTSTAAAPILPYLGTVDDALIFDSPWMKGREKTDGPGILRLVKKLESFRFDGCIIFNVYSQNVLPAALLAYLANIPLRTAYCRENPYHLLSHWIPDTEPLFEIQHQIKRDLKLLQHLDLRPNVRRLPRLLGLSDSIHIRCFPNIMQNEYLLVHLDVSDEKRQIPANYAHQLIKLLLQKGGYKIIYTGHTDTPYLRACIEDIDDARFYNLVGKTSLEELISLVEHAQVVLSVNTGVMHIACALERPVAVLYANTNPQHGAWSAYHVQWDFDYPSELKSSNQIIRYVDEGYPRRAETLPSPQAVLEAIKTLLKTVASTDKLIYAKGDPYPAEFEID